MLAGGSENLKYKLEGGSPYMTVMASFSSTAGASTTFLTRAMATMSARFCGAFGTSMAVSSSMSSTGCKPLVTAPFSSAPLSTKYVKSLTNAARFWSLAS